MGATLLLTYTPRGDVELKIASSTQAGGKD